MDISRAALGLLSALVVIASACSSTAVKGIVTETMSTGPDDGGATEAAAHDASPAPAPESKKDAAVAPPETSECGGEATQTACVTCCSNKHMDGAGTYFVALIDCMCVADKCAKDCAKTLCDPNNPQNADATCQGCVQAKTSACAPTVKTTCQADADCVAFDACVGKSDCGGKTN